MFPRINSSTTSSANIAQMKLLSIVGARPQFVKVAMIAEAIKVHNRNVESRSDRINHKLVHTGQHYEHKMSGIFFDELRIPEPDYHLGVGSGPQGAQTGAMLAKIEKVLMAEKPGVVMIYGDTNSTIAGALAAAKMHIKIAHLESGLRSFNRKMPEEINRVASDHISDYLFCPTDTAVENLRGEGIVKNVFQTGDVMLDSVLAYRERAGNRTKLLKQIGVKSHEYALATVHRAENTDSVERLKHLLEALASLPFDVILPMHPRVRDRLKNKRELRQIARILETSPNTKITAPVSYLEMLTLEIHARLVLTDSGGVQKEAFFAGVPCLTLREETEWLETMAGGWNQIVGTDPARIHAIAEQEWNRDRVGRGESPDWKSFGGGKAAQETVRILGECWKSGRERETI
jgi:UDP-GlcNAc3NAcA epimerase